MGHGHQIGGCRQVAVPEIVMNKLKMPEPLAGLGIQRQQAIGIQILAQTVATPEIEGCRAGRAEHDPPGFIEREARPHIGAADITVRLGGPGLVARLAGLGDGVEAPRQFSGANVESPYRAWSRRGRAFAQAHAHDEEVFEDDPGCRRLKGQVRSFAPEFLFQVDGTLLTKTRNASPGHHIDGVEEMVVGVKDAPIGAVSPIGQTTIDPALGDAVARSGVEAPFLNPGGRVEREEFQVGCRAIDHAIDHQWIALNLRTVLRIRPPTAIGPGNLQLPDILGLDLLQARMVAAARVTQVDGPVHGARRGPRSAEGQHRRRPAPCHPSSLLLLHAKSIQSIVPEPRRTAIEHEPVAATPVRGLARQGRRHRGNRPRKIRIHGQLHPGETIGWLCGGVEQ